MEASFRRTRASEHILFLSHFCAPAALKKSWLNTLPQGEREEKKEGQTSEGAVFYTHKKKYVCELVLFFVPPLLPCFHLAAYVAQN